MHEDAIPAVAHEEWHRFVHLDGYADTCDALASCAEPVKKRQILAERDVKISAFALKPGGLTQE